MMLKCVKQTAFAHHAALHYRYVRSIKHVFRPLCLTLRNALEESFYVLIGVFIITVESSLCRGDKSSVKS